MKNEDALIGIQLINPAKDMESSAFEDIQGHDDNDQNEQ